MKYSVFFYEFRFRDKLFIQLAIMAFYDFGCPISQTNASFSAQDKVAYTEDYSQNRQQMEFWAFAYEFTMNLFTAYEGEAMNLFTAQGGGGISVSIPFQLAKNIS